MKKIVLVVICLFFCIMFGTGTEKAFAESSTDVEINEQNFPDAKFRKMIKESMFNKDHDDILTSEEISNAEMLEIRTEDTICSGDWDITGVEKLKELKSVVLQLQGIQTGNRVLGREVKGTFQNNKKLTKIVLDADGRQISGDKIEQFFPIKQIRELTIQNADIQEIPLSKAVNLKTLTIKNCVHLKGLDIKSIRKLKELSVCRCQSLKNLRVSDNMQLEKITLENTPVKKIDLTKNVNLEEVSVRFGYACVISDLKTGKQGKIPFYKWSKNSCKIVFPQKNQIKKLSYFTSDKQLNISRCHKLREVHVSKNTSLKTRQIWYRKNGKKLIVYAEGFLQKKLKVQRKNNTVLIKAKKVKDNSKGYYCEELDQEEDS